VKPFIKLLIILPLNEETERYLKETGRYLKETGRYLKAHLR